MIDLLLIHHGQCFVLCVLFLIEELHVRSTIREMITQHNQQLIQPFGVQLITLICDHPQVGQASPDIHMDVILSCVVMLRNQRTDIPLQRSILVQILYLDRVRIVSVQ